jgi:hypothetical protein
MIIINDSASQETAVVATCVGVFSRRWSVCLCSVCVCARVGRVVVVFLLSFV